MDWTNTSHVMQAIYWAVMFAIAMQGYSMGNRSAI